MFSRFFIDRPIFASVISILITLAGAIALYRLPIAMYPPVAPPTVQVDCNYPGASSTVVAQTVAAPIEQQVNGVENMMYMASQCTADGSYTLTVTFKPGVDLNLAAVLVQNRVNLALPQLPDVVRATGVITKKRSPDILLTVSLNSPEGKFDQLYLSNYALIRVRDELARLPGISEVLVFGQRDYSTRIWLDPGLMAERNVTAGDVVAAIQEQNFQVATGQLGQSPAIAGQSVQIPLDVKGRLDTAEEFGEIVVKVGGDGRLLRLKDLARVELGARSHDIQNRFDTKPTVGLAVFQLPTGNALAIGDAVKAKMEELAGDFPEGLRYDVGYDTTPFIRETIREVFHALRDAILLVALVVLVFLQGWRPAVIPLIAVPVAIIGTFAAVSLVGFSLNNLTMFGLVLAIGIVVDDAIVVVEAVEHYIERGLAPREAAAAAMKEVSSPVIAVGLVLSAVFVPCWFIPGIVGQFFRQFALTIEVSTIISTINSLTLSPALAAVLLRPAGARRDGLTILCDLLLGWFFRLFNWAFEGSARLYLTGVRRLLRIPTLVLLVYGGLLGLTYFGFVRLPRGFIPAQDKGYLIASVQMPDATAAGRTREVISRAEKIALTNPGVKNVNSVAGNSFILSAYGSNFGSMFIILKDFDERKDRSLYGDQIAAWLRTHFAAEIPDANILVFSPPPVSGLGRAGGFKFMIEDRAGVGLDTLQSITDGVVKRGKTPRSEKKLLAGEANVNEVMGLSTVFNANSPQMFVDVDREACQTQGVNLADVFAALQATMGSRYVNDFNRFAHVWQVNVQAAAMYRSDVEHVKRIKVRNNKGQMVPLGAVLRVQPRAAPLVLTRYNMYPAAAITGSAVNGYSTGQAIARMEDVARAELPGQMAAEWTEITYLERQSSDTGLLVFALSVVFVFLVLSALYESWSLPLAVILVVPMCVLSSIAGVAVAGLDLNVFTQIGFVVLVGLACKNAILIVEFARAKHRAGAELKEAILSACQLRLRPILMTSFAFILGVVPLVFAQGAGAEMRMALGVAVFSGMLGVTMFGVFLTPVFVLVVDRLSLARLVLIPRLRRRGAPWKARPADAKSLPRAKDGPITVGRSPNTDPPPASSSNNQDAD